MSFRRSLSQVLNANVVAVLCNAVLVFGLPFFLSASDYGMWQLYQLYALLLGYITFGVTDGVYVRYAGRSWDRLPHHRIGSQFWVLSVGLTLSTVILLAFIGLTGQLETGHGMVLSLALLSNLAFIPRTLVTITFQAANRMLPYARLTVIERLLILLITSGAIVFGVRDFLTLILIDVAAKLATLFLAIIAGRDLFTGRRTSRRALVAETKQNLYIGIPVLFANLAIIALPSIARLIVEFGWSIEIFGSVSLGFNLSNMLLVVVNAAAIALFPRLRHVPADVLPAFYRSLEAVVSTGLAIGLLASFPMTHLASSLLPEFAEGLAFLPLMLAVFIFDSTMRLLGANWLKALRAERRLFRINLWSVIGGATLMIGAVILLEDVSGVLFALLLTVACRSLWAEAEVQLRLGRTAMPINGLFMTLWVSLFLVTSQFEWYLGALLYLLVLGIFVTVRRTHLKGSLLVVTHNLRQ